MTPNEITTKIVNKVTTIKQVQTQINTQRQRNRAKMLNVTRLSPQKRMKLHHSVAQPLYWKHFRQREACHYELRAAVPWRQIRRKIVQHARQIRKVKRILKLNKLHLAKRRQPNLQNENNPMTQRQCWEQLVKNKNK